MPELNPDCEEYAWTMIINRPSSAGNATDIFSVIQSDQFTATIITAANIQFNASNPGPVAAITTSSSINESKYIPAQLNSGIFSFDFMKPVKPGPLPTREYSQANSKGPVINIRPRIFNVAINMVSV